MRAQELWSVYRRLNSILKLSNYLQRIDRTGNTTKATAVGRKLAVLRQDIARQIGRDTGVYVDLSDADRIALDEPLEDEPS